MKGFNELDDGSCDFACIDCIGVQMELLSNVVYIKLTLGGFPAVDCAFINSVDELHAGNHISELPEST